MILIRDESANATLETVLFLPLALLLLFVGIDTGLSLIQRGAIRDDFRSAAHSAASYSKSIGQSGIREFSQSDLRQLVDSISEELNSNIFKSYGVVGNTQDGQSGFATKVSIYSVDVSPTDGSLNIGTLREEYGVETPSGGLERIATKVAARDFVAEQDFVSAEIEKEVSKTQNRFVQSTGFIHSPQGGGGVHYQRQSYLVYLEVRAIPNGINLSYLNSVLGSYLGFQQQRLEHVRFQ